MRRKIVLRSLLGAPFGLVISYGITILISLAVGDGRYYPVVPELIADYGSELRAVLVQATYSLFYGAVWGGISVIWEWEGWSLLRMTITHGLICSAATLPIAYKMRWMPRSAAGMLGYFAIFFAIYLCIWVSQYGAMKRRIRQMNERLMQHGDH